MKETKMKMYVAPAVKVVSFMIEHGYDATLTTESINPQTRLDQTGGQAGETEGYNRVTFEGWGSNE